MLIEDITPKKVRLTDLYSNSELSDCTELLGRMVDEFGLGLVKFPFTVRTMTAEQARKVRMFGQQRTVEAAFKKADGARRKVVAGKVKNFDNDRILVLSGGDMIDGHHHLMAAIKTGKPISYIDLDEAD